MFVQALADLPNLSRLTGLVTAVGALGAAAYGIVDASKAFFRGGVSTRGFANISRTLATLLPDAPRKDAAQVSTSEPAPPPALSFSAILVTLKSNWINGMESDSQVAIAKTLVKLRLNADSAPHMAQVAGVDPAILQRVAANIASGSPLDQPETDVYGRFDLILTTLLDQDYQRADQQYRATAKACAVVVSVALALIGAWSLGETSGLGDRRYWKALLMGLLATPLAPIAKDLSSAIQAGAQAAQAWTARR
jgi:hypothetical protein